MHPHASGFTIPRTYQKLLMVAKLTMLILVLALSQASARIGAQTVKLNVKNEKLGNVLREIKRQTGYDYVYNAKFASEARSITIITNGEDLQAVLQKCFQDQPFTYEITDKIIVIKEKSAPKPETKNAAAAPLALPPPPTDVTIVVTDADGQPLEGASVTVKGNNKGLITDATGKVSFKAVDDNAILVVSFTGYQSQEFNINKRRTIGIKLQTSTSQLDETVVIAYGKTTKRFATESIVKVKGEDIEKQPVGNAILALESRVPGLQIYQTSGIPGRGFTILLRGISSINASGRSPLYLVDGVPLSTASMDNNNLGTPGGVSSTPLASLNPQDIASIEVLKDADATAIYGSRGANGVILITTNKGKPGRVKLNINLQNGQTKATRFMDLLNREQYLQLRHEAFTNDGVTALPSNTYDLNGNWDTTRYTDWQKLFIGNTGHFFTGQASLTGGSENTSFLLGTNYTKETTIYPGNFYDERYSVHFSADHFSTDRKFKVSINSIYTIQLNKLPPTDFVSSRYLTLSPVAPALYDSSGKLNWQNNTWLNPFSNLYNIIKNNSEYLNGNVALSYRFNRNFQFVTNLGYSTQMYDQVQVAPQTSFNPASGTLSSSGFANQKRERWILEPQLNYQFTLGKAKLTASVGNTTINEKSTGMSLSAKGFSNDGLIENPAAATTIQVTSVNYSLYKYIGFFGKMNFNAGDKYLFNLTARRDGSSRFGPGNQFGNFGAAGIGWVFSKEKFISEKSLISFGKIRASYGTTGNDQIGDYQFLDTYTPYTNAYLGVSPLLPQRLQNPDYAWEKVNKLDLGLDIGLLKDKILISADYYDHRSSNQLLSYPLPGITGFTSVLTNLPAKIQNRGFELQVSSTNMRSKNFRWESIFNITVPQTILLAYPGIESSAFSLLTVGESFFSSRVLHYLGVDPQTGLYTFEDYDKDGKISSPNDYKKIINNGQQFYGGFENKLMYRGWSLDVNFHFVRQKYATSYYALNGSVPIVATNYPSYILERWQSVGQAAAVQKLSNSNTATATAYNLFLNSDGAYSDASFIRLKTVNIGYQLPTSQLKKMKIQGLRLYVSAQNLLTFTSYKGLDPETKGLTPITKVITTGIQITL